MNINNHFHTTFSDGNNSPQEMLETALEKGFHIITYTDHYSSPQVDSEIEFDLSVTKKNLKQYYDTIHSLKSDKIKVLCGLEIEFWPGCIDETLDSLKNYPFDFLLGGIHNIWRYSIDKDQKSFEKNLTHFTSVKSLLKEYFQRILDIIQTSKVDSIAHIDLVKKFNFRNRYFDLNSKEYKESLTECLETLQKTDTCMEINTSGLIKPVKEMYPSLWVLKKAYELGIPLTLGSDSHCVNTFHIDHSMIYRILKDIGYKSIYYFEKRKPVEIILK